MGVPTSWLYQSCQFSLPVTPVVMCILEVHSKCCLPSYLVLSYLIFLVSPSWKQSSQTVIGYFLAFFGNLGQFSAVWWLPYHDPPLVLFAISANTNIFGCVGGTCFCWCYRVWLGGIYFSNHLPKNSGEPFLEGDTSMAVPGALFHSWHWGNGDLVASVEAVIVIKTCCDSILSPICFTAFRSLCLINLSAPKGLSNTGIPMVSV